MPWDRQLLRWILSRADSVHRDMILRPLVCCPVEIYEVENTITRTNPNKGSSSGVWRRD